MAHIEPNINPDVAMQRLRDIVNRHGELDGTATFTTPEGGQIRIVSGDGGIYVATPTFSCTLSRKHDGSIEFSTEHPNARLADLMSIITGIDMGYYAAIKQ